MGYENAAIFTSPKDKIRQQFALQLNEYGVATTDPARLALLQHYDQACAECIQLINEAVERDDTPLKAIVYGSVLAGNPRLGIYPENVDYQTATWRQNFKRMSGPESSLNEHPDDHIETPEERAQLKQIWESGIPLIAKQSPSDMDMAIDISGHPKLIDGRLEQIAEIIFNRFGVLVSLQTHISPRLSGQRISFEELLEAGGLQNARNKRVL
jgi:hypothetical protein